MPSKLTNQEFEIICSLILKGNQVNPETLTQRLAQAALVGYTIINDQIVATGVVKQPTEIYRDEVFAKAQTQEKFTDYDYELGFIYTDDQFRGRRLSSSICQQLCENFFSRNLYATTGNSNEYMKRILERNEFVPSGMSFRNRNNTDDLMLFVKHESRDTFHIKIKKSQWKRYTVWTGEVTQIQKKEFGQQVAVSVSRSLPSNHVDAAINNILREVEKFDFEKNEMVILPAFERVRSLKDLELRLHVDKKSSEVVRL